MDGLFLLYDGQQRRHELLTGRDGSRSVNTTYPQILICLRISVTSLKILEIVKILVGFQKKKILKITITVGRSARTLRRPPPGPPPAATPMMMAQRIINL